MMKGSVRTLFSLLIVAILCGCVIGPTAIPPISGPLFHPTAEDAKELALLAADVEMLAIDCAAHGTCHDRMQFTRALLSLFENRDAARDAFEQVMTLHPSSPFAASSALWLQVLKSDAISDSSEDPQQRLLMDLTTQSVRELADRQSSGRTSQPKAAVLYQAASVHALSKQVEDRDRRIAELRSQLDSLKAIDQDHQERQRKIRAPTSLMPKGDHRP